jgi:phospholipid/cholesterol/gamma-HCH transport system substrate-binding protein
MKNNRPVIVGIFIVLGLAILIVTIFTLGGQKKAFVKTFALNAIFNDVSGLAIGANVLFSGVKIGTVKKIEFYGDSQVKVSMSIENDAESHIRKNAFAKIGSDGLIGNKLVVIYGGSKNFPQVVKNDFLKIENELSTEDMLATLQQNNKNLVDITTSFKSITKKIDAGDGVLGKLVNDPALGAKLASTINNLQTTVDNFKSASLSGKTVMGDFERLSGNFNNPTNSINRIANDSIAYNKIVGTVTQLQNASSSLNKFTANLRTVSEKLNRKDGPVGLMLNDSATANSLKAMIKGLQSSTVKLNDDLEAVQHNFLLKGFFKKRAKAQEKEKENQEKAKENIVQ